MLFSIYSQTKNGYHPRGSLVNLWGQVITVRGQTLVSRIGDATFLAYCVLCVSALSVVCVVGAMCGCWCVCVCVLVLVLVCHADLRAWCPCTRGRFECTHGGFQRATPHTATTTTYTTQHETGTERETERETERDRERQTETEKEDKTKEKRQDKKAREDERGKDRKDEREDQGIKRK